MVMMQLCFQILSIITFVSAFATTRELGFLRARQALEPTNVPSECTASCAPVFSEVQACGSKNTACLCTATVSDAGVVCADCIAGVLPSTLEALQSEADQDVLACQQEGHVIPPVTIVGAAVSSSNPTSPPAAGSPPATTNSPTTGNSSSSGGSGTTPAKSNAHALSGYLQPFFLFLSAGSVFFLGVY